MPIYSAKICLFAHSSSVYLHYRSL